MKPRDELKHEQKYVCTSCGNRYTTNQCLWVHMKSVHGEEKPDRLTMTPQRFSCYICGRRYTRKNMLQRHQLSAHDIPIKKHIPKNPRKYVCDVCDVRLTNITILHRHRLQIHGIEKEPVKDSFPCNFCERVFRREKFYERHLSACKKKISADF